MDISNKGAAQVLAFLLITAVVTQTLYTALYIGAPDVGRAPIWGVESVLFLAITAFAAVPMARGSRHTLGFAAIAASGLLNFIQVGIGATMFGPFREGAEALEATAPMAGGVVAFSFFVYNGAKVMLAFAALALGLAKMNAGGKALGGLTALVGLIALVTNALSMAGGRSLFGELPISGGSGVLATLLLALCVTSAVSDND